MTPVERIIAAVELNPDRPRVTLRRDDVREMLADHQHQAADIEHYKTAAVRLETMCAHHCAAIAAQQAEEARLIELSKHWREKAGAAHATLFDAAWVLPRAWMLYAATAFAGFMAHG